MREKGGRGGLTCDVTAACPVGAGTRGGAEAAAEYIAKSPASLGPLLRPELRRVLTAKKVTLGQETMAGYLKVLSSLSRSAAAFSRNPAALAPVANCQPQRNCELQRERRWHPQHHCVDVYSLDRASRFEPSLVWSFRFPVL